MTRSLPVSLMLHAVVMTALMVLGGQVARVTPQQHVMRVRMVSLPKPQPRPQREDRQETRAETPPKPVEESPPPAPAELEPKTLPEQPREQPRPRDPEPEVQPKRADEEPPPGPAEETTTADTGPTVATGVDFPFTYYVNLIERRVSRNWHPPPLDSYRGQIRVCEVQFVIGRGGVISRVTLAASSGVGFFDREALAAVKASSPLTPLPAKYPDRELPVAISFTLKPGF